MKVYANDTLFPWKRLDDCPSLKTVAQVMESVPDGRLIEGLKRTRGRGRNDYPVKTLWGVFLLKTILRHQTMESCLEEIHRNAGLQRILDIHDPSQIPNKWNMSRFLDALGGEPHLSEMKRVFRSMAERLGRAVPDLGRFTAGDSAHLSARNSARGEGEQSLPAADGGRKEILDESGLVKSVFEWHGYKLGLVVDVRHEVALSYEIESASVPDNKLMPALAEGVREVLPDGRMETMAYDKACDDEQTHRFLEGLDIKPLIETRSMWKDERERMLPGHGAGSNVVYDEAGSVYCYDVESHPPIRRHMAYIGHEPKSDTLKYRCPARHCRFECASDSRCNAGKSYGKTVRVRREIDLRRFPAIPRKTLKFERLYKGRTSVERVIGRLKIFWGADDGNITGSRRFHAYVGGVMLVHLAFATVLASCKRYDGALGRTRLSSVQKALQAEIASTA